MLAFSISRNAFLLGFFAILSTAIIAATYLSTNDIINNNIRKAEEKALLDIIPKSLHNNSMLDDTKTVSDKKLLGLRTEKYMYIAKQNDDVVAIIVPATARDGYTGDIDMIVGIKVDGTIAGVRVLSHRETPGLGDAIDRNKSDWVEGFNNKSLLNPSPRKWTVRKFGGEFDQFTGATITPRAVIKAVARALEYFKENKTSILKANTQASSHDGEG